MLDARPAVDEPRLPTRAEVRAEIPDRCFQPNLARSLCHLLVSMALVGAPVALAHRFLPVNWSWLPAWIAYAVITGTAATGLWVLAHECGHGAFSRNRPLQNSIGFVLHSVLLVPYFSWQRSHAVHHSRTNHLDEGETHVPKRMSPRLRGRVGSDMASAVTIAKFLLLGWPAYLLAGVTGGPARGRTNHFWPVAPFHSDLFPRRWHGRVWASTAGVVVVLASLVGWSVAAGSVAPVLALYVGPYLVMNAWLVTYTWLQHTGHDIPHFAEPEWSWLRGAFQTVDRPYGAFIDFLHHGIGSTHVAHHIDHRIPHYRANLATAAIRDAFPEWYRHDPTPVPVALWRAGRDCVAVEETPDGWYFTPSRPADHPAP